MARATSLARDREMREIKRRMGAALVPDPNAGWQAGDLKTSARPAPSDGWLVCDGSAVSRTAYAGLFDAIGTTYGAGNGSTTFNVPDLRGRAMLGAGGGPGLSARPLGEMFGTESVTLGIAEIPSHDHVVPHSFNTNTTTGGTALRLTTLDHTGANNANALTNTRGGGGSHTNMPPATVVRVYIKT